MKTLQIILTILSTTPQSTTTTVQADWMAQKQLAFWLERTTSKQLKSKCSRSYFLCCQARNSPIWRTCLVSRTKHFNHFIVAVGMALKRGKSMAWSMAMRTSLLWSNQQPALFSAATCQFSTDMSAVMSRTTLLFSGHWLTRAISQLKCITQITISTMFIWTMATDLHSDLATIFT